MKSQVLICHAYKSSPTENWYQHTASVLCERGYDARVLELPAPTAPSEKDWVECIKKAHISSRVSFIGHSLGARAILAYINQYKVKTERVVLVACPMFWEGVIETRPPLRAYTERMQDLDYAQIKNLVDRFDILHSTDDPLLPPRNAYFLKEQFAEKANLMLLDNYGHFDVDSVPEIEKLFS
ncbi:MAG: hypothetical protein ACD_76C00156G0003 [uncultured bacterium]|nr:MAG: hypothetical protein ACD_76C00156G0003 [uncultured bacterium]HBD05173.1 hypothetical protein [Candidatus Uhrbacteria bacterium]